MDMRESIELIGKIEACESLIARAESHRDNAQYSEYLLTCLENEIPTLTNPYLVEVWNRRLNETRNRIAQYQEQQIRVFFDLPTIHKLTE